MKKFIYALLIVAFCSTVGFAEEVINAKNTYAVIVGVLNWQDESLSPFSAVNRKDKELYKLLINKGVPKGNIIILLEKQATLQNIKSAINKIAQKSKKDSLFIFYYAGHGIKPKDVKYFANYDIDSNAPEETGLTTSTISGILSSNFNGSKILFMADCCYSGSLKECATELAEKGFQTAYLTSSSGSNISTGNWTFTQTIIDCLRGNPLADRNSDLKIVLSEIAQEMSDSMKYRERQKYGYGVFGFPEDFVFSRIKAPAEAQTLGEYARGEYVLAVNDNGQSLPARIMSIKDGMLTCQFYFYTEKENLPLSEGYIKKITYKPYRVGEEINVIWNSKQYPAKILNAENDFYYINYAGWPSYWDEWVMDDRIVPLE